MGSRGARHSRSDSPGCARLCARLLCASLETLSRRRHQIDDLRGAGLLGLLFGRELPGMDACGLGAAGRRGVSSSSGGRLCRSGKLAMPIVPLSLALIRRKSISGRGEVTLVEQMQLERGLLRAGVQRHGDVRPPEGAGTSSQRAGLAHGGPLGPPLDAGAAAHYSLRNGTWGVWGLTRAERLPPPAKSHKIG